MEGQVLKKIGKIYMEICDFTDLRKYILSPFTHYKPLSMGQIIW